MHRLTSHKPTRRRAERLTDYFRIVAGLDRKRLGSLRTEILVIGKSYQCPGIAECGRPSCRVLEVRIRRCSFCAAG